MLGLPIILAVLGAVTSINAQLIRNGGFEACTSEEGTIPFWTPYMGTSEFVSCSAFQPKSGNWGAIVGDQVSSTGYSQTSTLVKDQMYSISYSLAHIAGNDGPVMSAGDYSFRLSASRNMALGPTAAETASQVNYLNEGAAYGSYRQYLSPPFKAVGNDVIRFEGFSEFGFFMIDDIALIPVGGPIPSGVFTRERARRDLSKLERTKRDNPDCPVNLQSCPIPGHLGTECIDPFNELESCGGCIGEGGVDCTQIPGALGVGCAEGSCVAFSCQPGHALSGNGCVEI